MHGPPQAALPEAHRQPFQRPAQLLPAPDPRGRQLPAFEPQAGKWEELRWSLERLAARFGEDRLWRAELVRPHAARPEERARLVDIGP